MRIEGALLTGSSAVKQLVAPLCSYPGMQLVCQVMEAMGEDLGTGEVGYSDLSK